MQSIKKILVMALAAGLSFGQVIAANAGVAGKGSGPDQTYDLASGASIPIKINGTGTVMSFTAPSSGRYLVTVHLLCTIRGILNMSDGAIRNAQGVAFRVKRQVGTGTPVTLPGTGIAQRNVGTCNGYDTSWDYNSGSCLNDPASPSCAYVRETIATYTTLQAGKTYTFKVDAGAVYDRETGLTPDDTMRFTVRNVVISISN
jgi:hypothetical protein